MSFLKFLIAGFISLNICSCVSDEERIRQTNSPYHGEWFGQYKGDDSGNIDFKITNAGNIIGSIKSTNFSTTEDFLGYVQMDGRFNANTKKGYVFKGFLKNTGHSTGQWILQLETNNLTGTFDFQKK